MWWNNKSLVQEVEVMPPPLGMEFGAYNMVDVQIIGGEHPALAVALTDDLYATEKAALKGAKEWAESRVSFLKTRIKQAA